MLDTPERPRREPDVLDHRRPRWLKRFGWAAAGLAAVIVAVGLVTRFYTSAATKDWTEDQAVPTVQLIALQPSSTGNDIVLPGDIEAFSNAPTYTQVTGMVLKWNYDIGAKVKQGDLLAQIDTKSYQAALDQAKGALARDSATLAGAEVDLKRQQALYAIQGTARQMVDDAAALVDTDKGLVQADEGAVAAAQVALNHTHILAPFDGIVTSRSVDIGTLVNAAMTTPLFTVTSESKLRIYVHLPQNYATLLHPGLTAEFTVPEYPGRKFTAQFVAGAGTVASQSGTQLVQFQADNPDGALKPGDYAEMRLTRANGGGVRVPATALMFRDAGMMVATVDGDNHVVLKPITIGADLGAEVEAASGVTAADHVIDNPPDSLQGGDIVRVAAPPPPAGK